MLHAVLTACRDADKLVGTNTGLHGAHCQPKRNSLHHVQQHQHQHVGRVLDQGAILQLQQAITGAPKLAARTPICDCLLIMLFCIQARPCILQLKCILQKVEPQMPICFKNFEKLAYLCMFFVSIGLHTLPVLPSWEVSCIAAFLKLIQLNSSFPHRCRSQASSSLWGP